MYHLSSHTSRVACLRFRSLSWPCCISAGRYPTSFFPQLKRTELQRKELCSHVADKMCCDIGSGDCISHKFYILMNQVVHQARTYNGFWNMKWLGVFLLPLDGMLVHCRVTPQQLSSPVPFIHLGGERQCESKVSWLRTQHNVPSQGSNPDTTHEKLVIRSKCSVSKLLKWTNELKYFLDYS